MMQLKVNDAQLLTKTMTALAVIVDEATFKVDEAKSKLGSWIYTSSKDFPVMLIFIFYFVVGVRINPISTDAFRG